MNCEKCQTEMARLTKELKNAMSRLSDALDDRNHLALMFSESDQVVADFKADVMIRLARCRVLGAGHACQWRVELEALGQSIEARYGG